MKMTEYKALEARIRKSDLDALLARWEFGAALLKEREANGGKQLPKGRLEQVSNALATSQAELRNRMQLAEEMPKSKLEALLKKYGSWYEICARGLGTRGQARATAGASLVVQEMDLAELVMKPHPRNYKQHPPEQIEHIMRSIEEHGFIRPVVVARDYTILAGHGLVQAARQLGRTRVPVMQLDLDPDDPRALKLLVADN